MQTQSPPSNLTPTRDYGQSKKALGLFSISAALSKANQAFRPYKWYAIFRILRAHMNSQFSIAKASVDLGPSVEIRDGRFAANARTRARAEGIRKFLANHRWADSLHLRTFLSGFDAGEEYCMACRLREQDIQESRNVPVNQSRVPHP